MVDAHRHVSADVSNLAQSEGDELTLAKFARRLPHPSRRSNTLSATFEDFAVSEAMLDHAAKRSASRFCNVQMDQHVGWTWASYHLGSNLDPHRRFILGLMI